MRPSAFDRLSRRVALTSGATLAGGSTLAHQDGQTVYFSDRPERIVGSAPTQKE